MIEALPTYRPDCGECGHPMNPHFTDWRRKQGIPTTIVERWVSPWVGLP